MIITEPLQSQRVELRPAAKSEVLEYLLELIQKYQFNTQGPKSARLLIEKIGQYFWIGYADGIQGGVAYVSYIPDLDMWTFDAYQDRDVTDKMENVAWTYEAGKLAIPYILDRITPVIWTMHDVRNRAASIVCRRLGFMEIYRSNNFVMMRRDKDGY